MLFISILFEPGVSGLAGGKTPEGQNFGLAHEEILPFCMKQNSIPWPLNPIFIPA
jgi:hypothetical protein